MISIAALEAQLAPKFHEFNARWGELRARHADGVDVVDAVYRLRGDLFRDAARTAEELLYVPPDAVDDVDPEEVSDMWRRLCKLLSEEKIGYLLPPAPIEFEVEFSDARMRRVMLEMRKAGMPVVV